MELPQVVVQSLKEACGIGLNQVEEEIVEFSLFIHQLKLCHFMEIGTREGGTFYVLSKLSTGKKISLDLPGGAFGGLDENTCNLRNAKMKTWADNVHIVAGDSHVPEMKEKVEEILSGDKLDLLFIDGDHSYEGVKKDYQMYKEFCKPGGLIVFHDINDTEYHRSQNCRVSQFWTELKGPKMEFNKKQYWGGIGVLKNE